MEFYHTIMGHRFFEGTMPSIAKAFTGLAESMASIAESQRDLANSQMARARALERIANALEESNKRTEPPATDAKFVVIERALFEEAHAAVAFAVTQTGGGWIATYNKMQDAANGAEVKL